MPQRPYGFKTTSFRIGCLGVLLCSVMYFFLCRTDHPLLSSLDFQVLNAMFRARGEIPTSGKIAIIDVDEKSLQELGQWPWPRDRLAELVHNIHAAGARVIGLDMVFAEADRGSPTNWFKRAERRPGLRGMDQLNELKRYLLSSKAFDYDAMFGEALFQSAAVTGYAFLFSKEPAPSAVPFPSAQIRVSPAHIPFDALDLPVAESAVLNIPAVDQGSSEGFINFFPDPSGTVHDVPLLIAFNRIPYPSLALEVARLALGAKELTIQASRHEKDQEHAILGISIGERFIPTDTEGRISPNFRGPVHTFPYYPAVDVLRGRIASGLKGKIVLLGTSAAGLPDLRATPFSNAFPGVEIQATIIDNILCGDPFRHDRYTEIAITFCFILIGGMVLNAMLAFSGPLVSAIAGLFFVVLTLWGNYTFFFLNNRLVGPVYPLFTVVFLYTLVTLSSYVYKDREKRFIQSAFSHYLSPELVSQLMRDPERLSLSGEQKELTIFFSDIRNFTTISEGMPSVKLAELLNRYLTEMSDIVMGSKGMVDKYIGDAIMAIWGAPLDDPDQAQHAIRASLEMKRRLSSLNLELQDRGGPALSIGIGLNTGMASVGNFGSAHRFDYTVIGDNVNLASRLESLNKYYGTAILMTEHTREKAGDPFFSRFIDTVRVKGMKAPVRIFEPICEGTPTQEVLDAVSAFDAAVSQYRSGAFEKARELFQALEAESPHPINEVYLKRIAYFLKNPPPPDWDAVFTFNQK
jgi:adenylate cyclase